ncbi:MAG TPA: hypothetical protein DCM28_02195 [Phycisphaerales bacterium]|nr:hypothetical protein [Phycisphaerales bacterium]HCD30956.1 hypothetical protein [Phycisphaerales bacterium]|tara:strand:+ start:748 stop:1398 length:651 start_codon:yes stop_codon:yes gene_type:complete
MVLTCFSGSASGWITRASLPGDYWTLIFETLIWQMLVLSAVIVMYRFRPILREQLPQLLRHNTPWKTNIGIPATQEIIAAIISTLVAGIMTYLLIRNATPKQVLFSLVFCFALGAGIGQSLMPNTNPIAIFVSPGLVAIGSYLLVILRFDDSTTLLASLYSGSESGTGFLSQFPGSALALPIDYMSAGILGCCIGIGIVRAAADEMDDEPLPAESA